MLHCYSTVRLPGEHGIYFRILYPFSLWLGETGVPGFFFISGFLFFHSKKHYQQKLETRFHTLLIPYLLWNTLLLTLYIVAFLVVAGLAYMIGSGMFSGGAKADTDSIAVNDSAKVDAATTLSDASGNPVTFDGESVAGRPNGHGVMTYLNSSVLLRYEGELKSGSREDDAAVLYYKNGDKYSGSFKNDHFATGTYFVKESGERFQGTFKNDQPWNGVWYDSDDSVVGQIIDGEDAGI